MPRVTRCRIALVAGLALLASCRDLGPVSDAADYPYKRTARGVRVHGTTRVLVIPARFAEGDPEPMSGAALRDGVFGGAEGGPVAANFALASGGTFNLVGEVTDWVQTTVRANELGGKGILAPTREGDYVIDAITAVDKLVDFGRYDNDGPDGFPNSGDDDGIVDGGIVVLNSNRNTHCGLANTGGVHPHANHIWRFNGTGYTFDTGDFAVHKGDATIALPPFIRVGGWVAMGPLSCGPDISANTLAHELGHLLFGLPDLYHVVGGGTQVWEGRRWVNGCWELMASGSGWGCGRGAPVSGGAEMSTLGSWARTWVGWSTPVVVPIDRDSVYTLNSPSTGGTVLKLAVADSEYFLVEYRERRGIDGLPPGSGVLITHVDDRLPLLPAVTATKRYRVKLVEADDDDGLIRTEIEGGDRGVGSDAFGGSRTSFSSATHSGAFTTAGAALPFSMIEITIDALNHRATVRIKPS